METGVPARPDYRAPPAPAPKGSNGWQIATAVLALAFIVAAIFGGIQLSTLGDTRRDLTTAEGQLDTLHGDLEDVRTALGDTETALEDANTETSEQAGRLAHCRSAVSLGVRMDGLMHKLVTNALTFGSLAEWNMLNDRYDVIGEQWAIEASDCTGNSGDFTFS